MTEICKHKDCAGCYACLNACPTSSILLNEDSKGCLYPAINQETCIDCGLCQKVCPVCNPLSLHDTQESYIAFARDLKEQHSAASGGIASILSRFIVENNGVVYGSSAENPFEVRHIRVVEEESLSLLKGSKYVHSKVGAVMKDLLKDLKKGRDVLFVGTPCQVAGVRNFLRKDYPKFYCIDLVCHGVPTQKLLNEAIEDCCKENADKVGKIMFRRKDEKGSVSYGLYLTDNEGRVIYEKDYPRDHYSLGFMKALFYRPNCYACPYARPERCGDLTLGDFWEKDGKADLPVQRLHGVSMILCNTEKGKRLLNLCKQRIVMKTHSKRDLAARNSLLRKPMTKHRDYDAFQNLFTQNGYSACKSILRRLEKDAWKQIIMIRLSRLIYKLPFTEKLYSLFFRKKA